MLRGNRKRTRKTSDGEAGRLLAAVTSELKDLDERLADPKLSECKRGGLLEIKRKLEKEFESLRICHDAWLDRKQAELIQLEDNLDRLGLMDKRNRKDKDSKGNEGATKKKAKFFQGKTNKKPGKKDQSEEVPKGPPAEKDKFEEAKARMWSKKWELCEKWVLSLREEWLDDNGDPQGPPKSPDFSEFGRVDSF
ncbi:hypothetical protein ABW19_dt0200283 [Dactylella cylindrospora]|nr:hypothetical protein ABW19_dt0200283 [Dactylella cylindrospora]